MALDDFMEPEVGVAIALTAAVSSPKVRGLLRQAAVYGLAGALMAGDAVSNLARGVKQGFDQAGAAADNVPARQPARRTSNAARKEPNSNGRSPKAAARRPRPRKAAPEATENA